MAHGVLNVIDEAHGKDWSVYHADCVDVLAQLPPNAVDLSIYSPPFMDLFVYSDSIADMGNSGCPDEFAEHYKFMADELIRVTRPGRLCCVHCSEIPRKKMADGVIGLRDFPGDIIRWHEECGWIYHARVTIWRDPVVEMQRTKALGLLYKQLRKDSCRSRMGMADFVLVFRKDGENDRCVEHRPSEFPLDQWQKWASPVWDDIDQTKTLNVRVARGDRDEKHLCPLQLDVIERCLVLWSRRGDTVFSPFAGIGSEGVMAIKAGRRFLGVELKASYFKHAAVNLHEEESQLCLFE